MQEPTAWEGPLFLVGMPRSGTKLLRALLAQHPRIRIPSWETEFLPFLVRWVHTQGAPQGLEDFERLHAALRHSPYFTFRAATGRPFDPAEWQAACAGRADPAGLFEGFMRYELGVARGSGLIWADKSPNYVTCIALLLGLYPQARVIHLVRDVRDYCLSIRKAWGKDMLRAAHRWGRDVLAAHQQCAAQSDRCIEVRYEDLLRSPEEVLKRLCAFLRIPFNAAIVRLERPVENLGDTQGVARIVTDNHSKFRSRLADGELERIEALAWDAMQVFGYAPVLARGPRELSALSLGYRRLKDGVNLVRAGGRNRNWWRAVRFHTQHQVVVRQPARVETTAGGNTEG